MKKIIIAVLLIAGAHCAMAQNVRFTVQGGANMPSIGPSAPQGGGGSSKSFITFQFGGLVDIDFKTFGLQTGLLLTGKGNQTETTENFVSNGNNVPYIMRHTTNITYVELPVNGVYRHPANIGNWYVGAGPYVARAIWGSYRDKAKMNQYYNRSTTTDISFGSGETDIKAMDYGINALAGVEMKNGLKLGLNFGLGLANLFNTGSSAQNRVLSLVVGYSFK